MPYKDPAKKAAYMLQWQRTHRDRVHAANTKWAKENPEAVKIIRTRYHRRRRGHLEQGSPEHRARLVAAHKARWPGRFWKKVNKTDSCWLWTGGLARGYGKVELEGRSLGAHRVSYEMVHGPIPDGLQIDHLCFVKRCVNPNHMELVTPKENIRRAIAAGLRP